MIHLFLPSRFRSRKLLTQLFTVMLGFSAIFMAVVSIVVKQQTTEAFIKNNNLVNSNTLKVSGRALDALFSGFHDSLTHITYDGDIIDFIVVPKPEDSISNYRVWSVLNGYCQENEAISEIYLYIKKTDQVLTSSYETRSLSTFKYRDLISAHMADEPSTILLKSGRTTSIEMYQNEIYMVRDFPLNGDRRLGTLYMKINPTVLYNTLSGNQTSYSYLLAYDRDWNPLFPRLLDYSVLSAETAKSLPSLVDSQIQTAYIDKQHYFYTASDQAGLHLVLSVNDTYFAPSYQMILKNLLPFFALTLVLSGLLSVLILYLSYMPMLKLTKIVSSKENTDQNDKPKNEWEYLTESFLNISNQKYQLDHILTSMVPKISKEFYFELLNGRPMELSYLRDILKNINSPLSTEGTYSSIAVTFADMADISAKTQLLANLSQILEDYTPETLHYVMQQIDDSLYVIMVQYDPQVSDFQITSFEIKLEQVFFHSLKERVSLAFMEIGPKCDSIQNISYSYLTSLQRLTQRKYLEKTPRKKSEGTGQNSVSLNHHYFQIQLKNISDFVMQGDGDAALQKALQISESLTVHGSAEDICRAYEYYRLAFLDTLSSFHITEASDEDTRFVFEAVAPRTSQHTEALCDYMDHFCTAAVRLLVEKYQKQQHKYLIKAKQYIEQSYQDPDLSLNLVAEQCKTTTSYLSRLFKESFGINFIEYLNQYRIGKAKDLLRTTEQTVKEIALSTGFNSQQNFIRVFKKYTGITPGQFKAEAH